MHNTTTIFIKIIIFPCKSENNITDLFLFHGSHGKAWGSWGKLVFLVPVPFDDFGGCVLPFLGQVMEGGMEGANQTLHGAGWLWMLYDFIFALTLEDLLAYITECSVPGLTLNPPSERTWYSFPRSSLSYSEFHCNLSIQTRHLWQMANLAFPGTHLVAVFYLDMACPESQYIHCYGDRLPGSAFPWKGRGPLRSCRGSIVTVLLCHCCSLLYHHGLGVEVWVHLLLNCSTKVPVR